MSEHLSEQSFERYRLRKMSPAELLAADDHLVGCAGCRQRASEAGPTAAALLSLRASLQAEAPSIETDHVVYEQIAALVDNDLDATDREVVESHLEFCEACAGEVDDLRGFRATLGVSPDRKSALVTAPTLWDKFVALWHLPGDWSPLRLATAAVLAVLVLVTAALVLLWRPEHSPQTERAESSRPSLEIPPVPKPGNRQDTATPGSTTSTAPALPEQPKPPQTERPGDASSVALALNDGGRLVTLDQNGEIEGLGALPPASQRAVKKALTSGRVERPPDFAGLIGKSGILMGKSVESNAFALLSPVGTVTRFDRPTLRWRPLSGATRYTVAILGSDFNAVVKSPPLSGTEWTPATSLERGQVYLWQVTAVRDGEEVVSPVAPASEARFKVLEKAKADELERTEKANPSSHLGLGVLYAEAGLLDDAEREFRALVRGNSKSLIARRLLRSVVRLRRRG